MIDLSENDRGIIVGSKQLSEFKEGEIIYIVAPFLDFPEFFKGIVISSTAKTLKYKNMRFEGSSVYTARQSTSTFFSEFAPARDFWITKNLIIKKKRLEGQLEYLQSKIDRLLQAEDLTKDLY
jgi:hypothetical protein